MSFLLAEQRWWYFIFEFIWSLTFNKFRRYCKYFFVKDHVSRSTVYLQICRLLFYFLSNKVWSREETEMYDIYQLYVADKRGLYEIK